MNYYWKNTTDNILSIFFKKILFQDIKKIAGENAISSDELYKKHQLDIEEVYRKAGWVVSYDKPAYNENYDAIFTFKSKTSKK